MVDPVYFTYLIAGTATWALLVAASAVACARHRRLPSYLQLLGSVTFLVASLMNYVRMAQADASGTVDPRWIWKAQDVMFPVGGLLFAAGYFAYWIGHSRQERGFPVEHRRADPMPPA